MGVWPRGFLAGVYTSVILHTAVYVVLLDHSRQDDRFHYSFMLLLLLSAAVKFVLAGCSVLWNAFYHGHDVPPLFGRGKILSYFGSAAIYLVNDVFVFIVLNQGFDAESYVILVTGKIALVAVLSRFILGKSLNLVQCIGLVLLSVGIVLSAYPMCPEDASDGPPWVGYLVVLVAELVGGLAGIFNEYLMTGRDGDGEEREYTEQRNEEAGDADAEVPSGNSIVRRTRARAPPRPSNHTTMTRSQAQAEVPVMVENMYLYGATMILGVPLFLMVDGHRREVFGGTDGTPVLDTVSFSYFMTMLVVNSTRGLSISLVYKHSTNVTKIFCVAMAILITAAITHFTKDHTSLSAQFWLSFIIISCALVLYVSPKLMPNAHTVRHIEMVPAPSNDADVKAVVGTGHEVVVEDGRVSPEQELFVE